MTAPFFREAFASSGYIILIACIVSYALRLNRRGMAVRCGVLLAGGALALVPVGGIPLLGYPRGFLGDLSITSMVLLGSLVLRYLGIDVLSRRQQTAILVGVSPVALFLYIFSSGISSLDIYSAGFSSPGLAAVLAAGSILGWVSGYTVAALLPVAVLAYHLRLLPSDNLWDYLVDPLVALFSGAWGVTAARRCWRARALAHRASLNAEALRSDGALRSEW